MRTHPMTYLVFAVVLVTTVISFATQTQKQHPAQNGQQKKRPDQWEVPLEVQESRRNFPTADYNEGEPVDPNEKAKKREKRKRYNTLEIVATEPRPDIVEATITGESPDLPVIPIAESNVIIIGNVEGAEGHLSDNKKNVFSEFTVRIKEVLKSPTTLTPDSLITIDRHGGFVDYPNGQRMLYRFRGERMPRIGGHYVFFLRYAGKDLQILTAYELGENGASPLDESPQFRELKSEDAVTFLNTLRDSIKSTPAQEQ